MKLLRYSAPRKEKPGILHGMALFAICRQSCPIMRVNSCFLNPSRNYGRPTSRACPKLQGSLALVLAWEALESSFASG